MLPPIFALPSDILILVVYELSLVKDLAALSRTSRFFHALVSIELGAATVF